MQATVKGPLRNPRERSVPRSAPGGQLCYYRTEFSQAAMISFTVDNTPTPLGDVWVHLKPPTPRRNEAVWCF